MSKETVWIEQFTGMSVSTGAAVPGEAPSLAEAAIHFEKKRLTQRALLAEIREQLQGFKVEFQNAMATEITEGKLKGQKLLNEKRTQTEEIEAEDFSADQLKLSKQVTDAIAKGSGMIVNQNERLKNARFKLGDIDEPLFEKEEIQAEYWTPLMRERILPETYIPKAYSETQQMLDATNELYLNAIDDKKAEGKLTPKSSRAKDILGSASELMDLTGSLIGDFAPGSKEFKLATQLLSTGAAVLRQGGEVYDKVKDRKFGDAATTSLDIMGTFTATVLEQCGVGKDTAKIVKMGFAAGGAAIAAGQAFAKGVDGVGDGLNALSNVCAQSLKAAVAATSDPAAKKCLQYAAASVPMAFKQAAIGANIYQKVMDEDYAGIITCLGESMKAALNSAQELREIKATLGKNEEQVKEIRKQMAEQTEKLSNIFELSTTGAEIVAKTALTARRGEYMAALNELIGGIGDALDSALVMAGVPEDQAKMIAAYYEAASSAPKALECLMLDKPKVDEALKELSAGIATACGESGNDALAKVGVGLSMSLNAAGTGLKTYKLYAKGKYDKGLVEFYTGLEKQLGSVFQLPALKTVKEESGTDEDEDEGEGEGEGEGGDPPPSGGITPEAAKEMVTDLLSKLKDVSGDVVANQEAKKKLLEAEAKLHAEQKAARNKADEEEAALILAEAKSDLDAMSEAQVAGAEASSIDRLIAKMERDRMIMKLATQIAEGGAAFLAKFVPALGAVSAGVKLAANLFAAGQRAQQLYRWTQTQDDFEAAQSALSSSSQNFVKNQRDQLAHYAAQAIWAATELAGEIVKLAGPAGPAGAIVSAVATTGNALQVIVEKHKSREELEKAWKVTALALRNPGNRKLGLQARALNGSLAKYSIAWGAITLKDPLARNAMKACDLTEASLNDESSNVDKVVAYLESFYEDDPTLYRELDESPDWVPRDLELSLRSWARLKRQAAQLAQLRAGDTGKLDGWLALYETESANEAPVIESDKARKAWAAAVVNARKTVGKGKKPPIPVAEQQAMAVALQVQCDGVKLRVTLLEQMKDGFKAYVPLKKEGNDEQAQADAAAMIRAVAVLAKQAASAAAALEQEVTALEAQIEEVKVEEVPVVEPETATV